MDMREHSFLSIPLKFKFSFPSKFEGMRGNEINDIFTKTSKIPLHILMILENIQLYTRP